MDFDTWYRKVDALCTNLVGMGIDDFPDWSSRAYFDDEMTPEEALAARFDLESSDLVTMSSDKIAEHIMEQGLF